MGAARLGFDIRDEWLKKQMEFNCGENSDMRAKVNCLKMVLREPETFFKIFTYAYDFGKVYIYLDTSTLFSYIDSIDWLSSLIL